MLPCSRLAVNPLARIQQRLYHELSYTENGPPSRVLEYVQMGTSPAQDRNHKIVTTTLSEELVTVDMRYAPWNPADQNLVEGKYPSSSIMNRRGDRIIAGAEGIGRLDDGRWVTLCAPTVGSFRSVLRVPQSSVLYLPCSDDDIDPAVASLFQLAGTAWGLLRMMPSLHSGDVIVQNAGNSGVGFVTSQLARTMGYKTVSIVRRKDDDTEFARMVEHLETEAKADMVVSQEELISSREAVDALKTLVCDKFQAGLPKLVLNTVGGSSSNVLMQLLAKGGTHVTYGGMSMRPVSVPTASLIFRDIVVRGYWHSRYVSESSPIHLQSIVDELMALFNKGQLKPPPVEVFPLSAIDDALIFAEQQSNATVRRKVIFDCSER